MLLEATPIRLRHQGPTPGPEKRGLIRRLKQAPDRAVLMVADATILRWFPPLRAKWAFVGEQPVVRITGQNAKRVIWGALNIRTGHRIVFHSERMRQQDFQQFLRILAKRSRGLPLWLLLDQAPCHEAQDSKHLASRLGIQLLPLPRQCSELNGMDHLWRELKRLIAANRQFATADELADIAQEWVLGLTNRQALRKAGLLSADCWLRLFSQNLWRST